MVRILLGAALALFVSASARANWQEASSPHFVVYADDTPEHVQAFSTLLERFHKAMHVLRGVPDFPIGAASRVTVFVVRDQTAIERLFGNGGGNVAGFYEPRASGSVAFVPRRSGDGSITQLSAQAVLFHEYSHHWMYSNWGQHAFPSWFVEGFAEFNATAKFAPDGSASFGIPPLYRSYGMGDNDVIGAQKLLTATPSTMSDVEQQVFYGRSWLLLHYLSFDPEGRKRLAAYIAAINGGRPVKDANSLLGDQRSLDGRLNAYMEHRHLLVADLAAPKLIVAPVAVRALSPAEAAIMPWRIMSSRGVNKQTAGSVVSAARKISIAYPNDPVVQNEVAEAEHDAGNFSESDAATTRALAADPKSVHALVYRGLARLGAARKAKSTDTKTWQEVRHWYAEANHIDPDAPWPLQLYYESFVAAGQTPTINAQNGLLAAHNAARFDHRLSMEAATVELLQGKADAAREALRPVAYDPHGGTLSGIAVKVLAALDQPKGDNSALALLQGTGEEKATMPPK